MNTNDYTLIDDKYSRRMFVRDEYIEENIHPCHIIVTLIMLSFTIFLIYIYVYLNT